MADVRTGDWATSFTAPHEHVWGEAELTLDADSTRVFSRRVCTVRGCSGKYQEEYTTEARRLDGMKAAEASIKALMTPELVKKMWKAFQQRPFTREDVKLVRYFAGDDQTGRIHSEQLYDLAKRIAARIS